MVLLVRPMVPLAHNLDSHKRLKAQKRMEQKENIYDISPQTFPSPKQLAVQKLNKRWGLCVQKEITTDYSSEDLLSFPLSLLKPPASTASYSTKLHSVTRNCVKNHLLALASRLPLPIYVTAPYSSIRRDKKQ